MTRLTAKEIEAIRKRAKKATEGPWAQVHTVVRTMYDGYEVADASCSDNPEEDAEFIMNARTDIPKLLAEVERLQSQVDRMVSSAYEYLDTSTHTYMVAEEIEREDA